MWVQELPMVMYLSCKVRVVFLRGLEHNLEVHQHLRCAWIRNPNLRAVRELVCGQIDLAKRSCADKASKCVVAHGSQVFRREFSVEGESASYPDTRTAEYDLLQQLIVRIDELCSTDQREICK